MAKAQKSMLLVIVNLSPWLEMYPTMVQGLSMNNKVLFPGFHDFAFYSGPFQRHPGFVVNLYAFCNHFLNCRDNFWLPWQFLNCPTISNTESLLWLKRSAEAGTIFLYKNYWNFEISTIKRPAFMMNEPKRRAISWKPEKQAVGHCQPWTMALVQDLSMTNKILMFTLLTK